jgi:hypothetical protein
MENKKKHLQQMIFIYNAVQSGWIVKKKNNNTFEFIKKKSKITKEFDSQYGNMLLRFIEDNNTI